MNAPQLKWSFPPRDFKLSEEEIHVWAIDLDLTTHLEKLEASLSHDEKLKAKRFRFDRDRNRFVAGRGVLRAILGFYTRMPPASLVFQYEKAGKPCLTQSEEFGRLNFNLSHAGRLALYAVTNERELGIDVEKLHSFTDMEDVAARCFLPEEQSMLKALQPPQKEETFFRYWTRKEAQLKCSGVGFSSEAINDSRFDGSLVKLEPADGYASTLAVRGKPFELKTWRWR